MTDWTLLNHAYGNASDIPYLLRTLSPDPSADVWEGLWSRVCHQGTIYSASFPVLPFLLEAAVQWPAPSRVSPLSLAGSIVSSDRRVDVQDTAAFRPTIDGLHKLALATLSETNLAQVDFIYLLESALALAGDALWGGQLNRLVDGEFEGVCSSCGASLQLVIGQYGFFATADEWVNKPVTLRAPIEPGAATDLSSAGKWMYEQAVASHQPTVAMWVSHVFGSTTCPACGDSISVAAAIEVTAL
jgi:hypothetical protein